MNFERLLPGDEGGIKRMSAMATRIVREHFDSIIGAAQNDYMIQRFQTPSAIREQLDHGSSYYFVSEAGKTLGFLAFYPRGGALYLSKFYLYKEERGKGLSRPMLAFVAGRAKAAGLGAIELNVNRDNDAARAYEKLGFTLLRTEKNDIGAGFFMDDYVYRLQI